MGPLHKRWSWGDSFSADASLAVTCRGNETRGSDKSHTTGTLTPAKCYLIAATFLPSVHTSENGSPVTSTDPSALLSSEMKPQLLILQLCLSHVVQQTVKNGASTCYFCQVVIKVI